MKKFIILLIILLIFFNYKEKSSLVFSYIENEVYDNYKLNFKYCSLSTDNFISIFRYFENKDFKILEIIPYNSYNNSFLFYSNNIYYILDKFKNNYLDIMINESKYTNNICIKSVIINTSNYELDNFKNIIYFTY